MTYTNADARFGASVEEIAEQLATRAHRLRAGRKGSSS